MKGFDLFRFLFAVVLAIGLITFSIVKNKTKKTGFPTAIIAKSAIFAAISIILYIVPIFNISLPIFPEFLKLHFDEIPVFIAGFAYGPMSAILILIVKTVVKLPMTSTLCVGELADLLYSLAFVLPAILIYKKNKKFKSVIIGLLVSTFIQIIVASFVTSFVTLNFFIFLNGWKSSDLLMMVQKINPRVSSLGWPFLFMVEVPFNALKDAICVALTILLYKRVKWLLDKIKA